MKLLFNALPKYMIVLICIFSLNNLTDAQEMGVGIVFPKLIPETAMYFYGAPDFNSMPNEIKQYDSLTFFKGENYVDIETAPPWFVPEYIKLEYDILLLRAVTITENWIEVVVNKQSQQTAWVYREDVQIVFWEDFLLNIFSVEVIDSKKNPVKIKPQDNASVNVKFQSKILMPIAIKNEWMQVYPGDPLDKKITGWIKWRDKNHLLISYSMLD